MCWFPLQIPVPAKPGPGETQESPWSPTGMVETQAWGGGGDQVLLSQANQPQQKQVLQYAS